MKILRAAAELGLTQTAVSHQIRLLEEQWWHLFSRIKARIPHGCGTKARPTQCCADPMDEAFGPWRGRIVPLSVSTTSTFATVWLAPGSRLQIQHQGWGRLSVDRNSGFLFRRVSRAIAWAAVDGRARQHFLFRLHRPSVP